MPAVAIPNQFGGSSRPPIPYRGIKAAIPQNPQARTTIMPINLTAGTVKAIIGVLFGIICGLVGTIYLSMIGDIGEIKKDVHSLSIKVDANHVELIKSINAVEKQAVVANSRLDSILQELQRPKSR